MQKLRIRESLAAGLAVAFLLCAGSRAGADDQRHKFRAKLSGYQETPSTLSTPATGKFTAKIDNDAQTIDYELSYEGFETTAMAAHIHLGARATSGGVSAFLCGGGTKPACPATAGTVTGTITPADIIGPVAQGIAPGEFAEVVRAIRAGAVYANVHSTARPGGEIRGQLRGDNDDDNDDN
ncbi:MAG: CHRD domain-containing protein [Acidobacteria bacterium]|nr:MAG: CHRD domain-containing protein [Acidobacteriota bacterium]